MAAKIFRRLGASHEEYLAEAHCGLGEILMENQNCAEALKDYGWSYYFIAIFGRKKNDKKLILRSFLHLCSNRIRYLQQIGKSERASVG